MPCCVHASQLTLPHMRVTGSRAHYPHPLAVAQAVARAAPRPVAARCCRCRWWPERPACTHALQNLAIVEPLDSSGFVRTLLRFRKEDEVRKYIEQIRCVPISGVPACMHAWREACICIFSLALSISIDRYLNK